MASCPLSCLVSSQKQLSGWQTFVHCAGSDLFPCMQLASGLANKMLCRCAGVLQAVTTGITGIVEKVRCGYPNKR